MQLQKFSIALFLIFNTFAFNGNDCFSSSFDVSVEHKSFPFGLLKKNISISKKGCEITISHKKWQYYIRNWTVDICRNPVHIKAKTGSTEVLRKFGSCTSLSDSFCSEFNTIKKIIEDDALIFAKGLKSDLGSDHGKSYCSYLLLNQYLEKSTVFNNGFNYDFLTKDIRSVKEAQVNDDGFKIDPNSGKADF